MTYRKARILCCLALAGLFVVNSIELTQAQTFPTKPVRILVPYPPGGASDAIARVIATPLSEKWGQPVLVDNRPGAGTIIATEMVGRAAPDGHTLLIVDPSFAINAAFGQNLPYDPYKNFEPVTNLGQFALVLAVHPSVPANTVGELIAYAKANPTTLTYASSGGGTTTHVGPEIFKYMAGINMLHVPYKGGGPAVLDLVAGRVSMFFAGVSILPHVQAGRLRALAVGNAQRSPFMPNIPTMAESGLPGYEVVAWQGIFTTGGVPKPVVAKIQADIAAVLTLPNVRTQLANIAVEPIGSSPEDFSIYLKNQIDLYTKVIRAARIKPD